MPKVEADEVLIKVTATTINPADVAIRKGWLGTKIEFPFIPNYDVCGVIDKVGGSVHEFHVGDQVYAFLDIARNGAAAEYVVSKAVDVALAPKNIYLKDDGVIPSSALTAWQSLFDLGNLQAGQRVLVTAAAGGVGSFAVQLAKWKVLMLLVLPQNAVSPTLKKVDGIFNFLLCLLRFFRYLGVTILHFPDVTLLKRR